MKIHQDFLTYFTDKFFHKTKIYEMTESFIEALLIFLFFYLLTFITRFIGSYIRKNLTVQKELVVKLVRKIINILLIFAGMIAALDHMGIDIRVFIVELGLIGFALSYAFKDVLSNLLSGIMIILYQPFKVGSIIEVSGVKGEVVNIDMRHTTIIWKKKKHLFPNSKILSNQISVDQ